MSGCTYSIRHNCMHRSVFVAHGMQPERARERYAAVQAYLDCNGTLAAASKRIGKAPRYIKKWYNSFKGSGGVQDRPRAGRPPILSKSAKRKARVLATTRKHSTCKRVANTLHSSADCVDVPSKNTVSRALYQGRKKMVYGGKTKQKELPMGVKTKRLKFCRTMRDRSWQNVLVLDSKIFPLGKDGMIKQWHYAGQTQKTPGTKEKRKLHAYGAACIHGVTTLRAVTGTTGVTSRHKSKGGQPCIGVGHQEFIDVLNETIIPQAKRLFNGKEFAILMDKAPPHTPAAVKQCIRDNGIKLIEDWPGNSPDLNGIENLWGMIEMKLRGKNFMSIETLERAVNKEWDAITKKTLKRCASSMGKRMRKCIRLKGGHTGY